MKEYREEVSRIHAKINESYAGGAVCKEIGNPSPDIYNATLGRGSTISHNHILAAPLTIPKPGTNLVDGDTSSPFHPTIALRAKPNDLTTGCAGGYSTTRKGEQIFSNDDHGASSASLETGCVTIDTSFSLKNARGSVSRIGKDGVVSRINYNDNKLTTVDFVEPTRIGFVRPKRDAVNSGPPPGSHLLSVLPPLPVIPVAQGEDGNLAFTSENRPKYNSLRHRMEGPTEYSCWIIPGILAMGTVPIGRAWRRRQVKSSVHTRIDAASQLVLSGISTFVSLLSHKQEEIGEKRCPLSIGLSPERGGFGPIAEGLESGKAVESVFDNTVSSSRSELKNVISSLKGQIENWNADIRLNEVDDPLDLRYENSLKEDLRLRARRAIAVECSDAAKKELAGLWDPNNVKSEFLRLPIEQDSAPDLNDFLPILWKLEKRLMSGERLYVYSLDGHGRCGLVCGCLLGRLYGLEPRETLFRMQVYHDFIASQVRRLVPINCPQLINQQELLSAVLRNTNRVFDGVLLRSQLDPQTNISELHHLERGSQIGVYGVAVREFVEKRTVPTTYVESGGKSTRNWTDVGEKSFSLEIGEENDIVENPSTSSHGLSRRFTQSSGGYSKKGLSLRNSRSMKDNPATQTSSFSNNEILSRKPSRVGPKRRKTSKRRATTGMISSDSEAESDKKDDTVSSLKKTSIDEQICVTDIEVPITLPAASPCPPSKNRIVPNRVKSLRPAPADGPKLPSIRSRYGNIA